MDKKYSFELKRKLIHLISIILVFISLSLSYNKILSLLPILIILFFSLIFEYLRIKKVKIPIYSSFFREKEKNRLGGHIYYLIGIFLVLLFFNFDIAFVSILMLVFGDTTATLVGMRFNKLKKTNEGTIAELIVNIIIGIIFLPYMIAIPMAIMATITEYFTKRINDNIAIPIVASLTGQIMRLIL